MASRVWTVEQVRGLGVTTDLATAASVLGIGRSHAYRLATAGTFPAPVIKAGTRIVVPVAGLLHLLLINDVEPESTPARDGTRLDRGDDPSVHTTTTQPADSRHRRRRTHDDPGEHW
jgi:hypothetical protein